MNEDKEAVLAEFIWDKMNELDYDPTNPNFDNLDKKRKEMLLTLSVLAFTF